MLGIGIVTCGTGIGNMGVFQKWLTVIAGLTRNPLDWGIPRQARNDKSKYGMNTLNQGKHVKYFVKLDNSYFFSGF